MLKTDATIKTLLHWQCLEYIENCIKNAQLALTDALQSGNTEGKSSAGDKHETTRALLQIEQEKHTKQLQEMVALKEKLMRIDPLICSEIISTGSVVVTSAGNFYIAIAAGKLLLDDVSYFAISPNSPIAIKLIGLKEKGVTWFNGITYVIESVF